MSEILEACLPPEVYENHYGDIILCQEWPDISGDRYMRVVMSRADAERVCRQILVLIAKAPEK